MFDSNDQLDLRSLSRPSAILPPMELDSGWGSSFNYDGALIYTSGNPVATHTHVFGTAPSRLLTRHYLCYLAVRSLSYQDSTLRNAWSVIRLGV